MWLLSGRYSGLPCGLGLGTWSLCFFQVPCIQVARLVEAGGVEPPSEKRYGPKPTCLAQFIWVRLPRSE
jgi:hypothetical protein